MDDDAEDGSKFCVCRLQKYLITKADLIISEIYPVPRRLNSVATVLRRSQGHNGHCREELVSTLLHSQFLGLSLWTMVDALVFHSSSKILPGLRQVLRSSTGRLESKSKILSSFFTAFISSW
jgi:hypothetical protein